MKETFKKAIILFFNKLFKTRIDFTTLHLLRNTSIPSTDLNRFIDLYKNDKDDLVNFYEFYREFHSSDSSQQKPFSSSLVESGSFASYLNILLDLKKSVIRIDDINNLNEGRLIFSQEGEDLVLFRIFNDQREGFFVDIGAHHPKRFSNTFFLYRLGWRGINIEPNPDVKRLFDDIRPEDINIETAIGNDESESTFYMFQEPALNTFSQSLAEQYERSGQKLMGKKTIKTRKLSSVLDEHVNNRHIDFMSIDVEDYEMSVLESNNWIKYRPKILLIEILDFDVNHPEKYPIHNFVVNKGYSMCAKTYNTVFYKIN